jgi:hypothetical protein
MTRITVIADYDAFPLWIDNPMQDPTSLPLSPDLRARLTEWGQEYTEILTLNAYQWPSAAAHQDWNDQGWDLTDQVQHELGADVEVIFFDDLTATPTRSRRR